MGKGQFSRIGGLGPSKFGWITSLAPIALSAWIRPNARLCAVVAMVAMSYAVAPASAARRFYPAVSGDAPRPALSPVGTFSLGLALEGLVPTGSPYRGAGSASNDEAFRYQLSTGVGLEVDYALLPNLELGLSVAWSRYESRLLHSASSSSPEFFEARYRALPVIKAIARFRRPLGAGVNFETEGALGPSFGRLQINSTQINGGSYEETQKSWVAHAIAGLGLAWADGYSAHFGVGYGLQGLGAKKFGATALNVQQAGSIQGLLLRSQVRVEF